MNAEVSEALAALERQRAAYLSDTENDAAAIIWRVEALVNMPALIEIARWALTDGACADCDNTGTVTLLHNRNHGKPCPNCAPLRDAFKKLTD